MLLGNEGDDMTEAYEKLAALYEPAGWGFFAEWMAARMLDLATQKGLVEIRHIVDVACGTGIAVSRFAEAGYQVTGIDRSAQMLAQARKRAAREALPEVSFIQADMREFTIVENADMVTCMYDSLNYLLTEDDLAAAFRCAAAALRPGGLYLFDVNTVYGLEKLWGRQDFIRWDSDDIFIVGRTRWHQEDQISTLVFHGFIRQGDLWERFKEAHIQRGYPVKKIRALLEQTGAFTTLGVYDGDARDLIKPGPETGRVLFVARREDT